MKSPQTQPTLLSTKTWVARDARDCALTARFWSRVYCTSAGCLVWASPNKDGYGRFHLDGKSFSAHRWAYERIVGPIPAGLTLDHLCRNRACVKPSHLEPVPIKENVLRGVGMGAMNSAKTHCMRGHPLSGKNLGLYFPKGVRQRRCLTCANAWQKAKKARLRAEASK